MQPETKRLQVEKVWGWSGEVPPDDPRLMEDAMSAGVANPGPAFNNHRWREVVFFIRLLASWKQLPPERQRQLAADGWSFGQWMDSQEESSGRQLRHMLLFLLFQDDFSRTVTSRHKRAIVKRWYAEAGGDLPSLI